MSSARRHKAFRAVTGWWATAVRALALVLALAVGLPTVGVAEDLAFHQSQARHAQHDRTERSFVSDTASGADQAADPGLACHVHCGCHVAMNATVADQASAPDGKRPSYARAPDTLSSLPPDRLPRPPRA